MDPQDQTETVMRSLSLGSAPASATRAAKSVWKPDRRVAAAGVLQAEGR